MWVHQTLINATWVVNTMETSRDCVLILKLEFTSRGVELCYLCEIVISICDMVHTIAMFLISNTHDTGHSPKHVSSKSVHVCRMCIEMI